MQSTVGGISPRTGSHGGLNLRLGMFELDLEWFPGKKPPDLTRI
jgi:hypothetical protein